MKRYLGVFVFCTMPCLFMIFEKPAYAYIDPGTGSMIIQAVIAAVAVASVSIGIFWRRFRSFFGRLFGRGEEKRHDSNAN